MKSFKKWLAAWWISCASLLLLAACGGSFETEASRFSATLTGDQEVPPTGSAATGTGVATVNPETLLLTATINTTGITGTAAHIHEGAPGQAGPIIFPMTQTAPGSGVWVAAVTITKEQLATLRAGNYFFNVHSAAFPNGEIRGQIKVDQFSSSSTTSSGGSTTTTSAGGTTTSSSAGGTTTTSVGGTTTSTAATTTSSAATTTSTEVTTTTLGGGGTTTTTAAGGGTTTSSIGGTTTSTAAGGITTTTVPGGITTTTAPGGITTTTAPGGITTTTGVGEVTTSTTFPGITTTTLGGTAG